MWVRAAELSEGVLPAELTKAFVASGLPLKSFGLYARPVDNDTLPAFAALNAEQAFLMASTTKVVTSLVALDLLGADYRWRTRAYATGAVRGGRLAGDLVIVGGNAGLTPSELSRWFKQMRTEGLSEIAGHIVLEHLAFLHESNDWRETLDASAVAPIPSPESTAAPMARLASAYVRRGAPGSLVVTVAPSNGPRAIVTLSPRPAGITVVNDVRMGEGCTAWAVWESADNTPGAAPQLMVRGQWDSGCGKRDVAAVRAPASLKIVPAVDVMPTLALPVMTAPPPLLPAAPRIVAGLWEEAGGRLRGRVIETERWQHGEASRAQPLWSSQTSTPLTEMLREMNKTSNNLAARSLLLSLGAESSPVKRIRLAGEAARLRDAQDRVQAWLRAQGLADSDIHVDVGSGQSRAERGKPRALVQLLANAWRGRSSKAFVESLPIAGVDGTLAHRMTAGPARGQAFLKTGTLSDTRALAGYVRARSGKVYAVAAIANHPNASRATLALDAFIEWVAKNG
jgi:D-alanyl-D-alanine carboxypeptidase/D-alanyl-D-alanine-endopeptidase (penicillin-binding protein 4)